MAPKQGANTEREMKLKSTLSKRLEESDRLIERIESNIRDLPTALNKKLAKPFNKAAYLGHYLHFLNAEVKAQNLYIEQCDDLRTVYERLNAELGEETYVGEWFEVSQQLINQFAEVTDDQQWIHTDPQKAAEQSPYKSTIAHGFLTLSLIPKLTNSTNSKDTLYPEARMVVNQGLKSVVYPYPVKVGKRVRARSRVTQLTAMKQGLEIVREVKVEIEKISRPACIAEVVIRLYF